MDAEHKLLSVTSKSLRFGWEEMMRFGEGLMFLGMKIKTQTANVSKVNENKVEGAFKTSLGHHLECGPTCASLFVNVFFSSI